ncbi:MAG TPA: efflux RND transporter periplasmic adaptor subunit [Terriglobales bacterium]|nr:efflux RND transporter periplasmic adaptor subunit [Terriglobales bacterium]
MLVTSPSRFTVPTASVAGLCLLAVCGCSNFRTNSAAASRPKAISAHVYTVTEETTRRRVQAVGSLYPLEESTLSAEVEGRVSEVLADVGDSVREGQSLILLDQRELRFEVERQQGLVRQVRAQLGLGPSDPPPRDSHQLPSVQKADADRFDAERKYDRAQALFKDNLISQQQFDEAKSRFQSTQASFDLALEDVERLKALLISGEASEHLAEKKLADATIRAPYPGSVKSRAVHPGEYLRLQSPVMVLVRTDRLRARLAVPERWAGWIKDGALVDLHVEAFPAELFQGKISRINPAVSQDSRTFEAEAIIENRDARLKAGFFVQASIPSEKEEKTISVPEAAVNYRYGVYKVFLVNGNRVSERQIRPAGQSEGEQGRRFEVAEGLKAGDRVAATSSGELHDGDVIQESAGASEPAAR